MCRPAALAAQTNPKAVKWFEQAKSDLAKNKTSDAILKLEKAIESDPAYREAYLELFRIWQSLDKPLPAITVLQKAAQSVRSGQGPLWYNLAQLELQQGWYAQAHEHFNTYLSLNTPDTAARSKAAWLQSKARFALEHLKDSLDFRVRPLNALINTGDPEYLPSIDATGNLLVFTRRTGNQEDLWISLKRDGEWSGPSSWPGNSNQNEGAHVISADGKTIVFTACGREDGFGGCDLYSSDYRQGRWTRPKNMDQAINSRAWESQPSLSANGRILYFVSDRPGGLGGYDIWVSFRRPAGWTNPVNAGPYINTVRDELSPCLHADGLSLYFRSDGWPGFGSQDLFVSKKSREGIWSQPLNLGYPLNDHRDQGALVVSLDGRTAYYSDQKISSSNQLLASDIVSLTLPQPVRSLACTFLKGRISDLSTNAALSGALVTLAGGEGLLIKDSVISDPEGEFLLVVPVNHSYQIHARLEGYNLYSERLVAGEAMTAVNSSTHDIKLEKIKPGAEEPLKPVILENVLFETASFTLLPESYYELDALSELLKQNPSFSLAIHGHTDNTGDPEFNRVLSGQRANAVYAYLLTRQIEPFRMTWEGFGDRRPIASNDSEEGRRKNRRVEFVLSKSK